MCACLPHLELTKIETKKPKIKLKIIVVLCMQFIGRSSFVVPFRWLRRHSPLLFNAVLDRAIDLLPPDVGYKMNGLNFNCIAYADDMKLVATTKDGLQALIDVLSGEEKKMKVITEDQFKVNNQYLKLLSVLDTWKYFGIKFRVASA